MPLHPMSESLAQRIAYLGATRGDGVAYLAEDSSLTWRGYEAGSSAMAAALVDRLNLERGARVAVLLPDGPDVHTAFVANEKAGLVTVGLGQRAGAREIVHLLRLTGARALITPPEHQGEPAPMLVRRLRESGVSLAHHAMLHEPLLAGSEIWIDGEVYELASAREAARSGIAAERALAVDELFLLNSTSGTTGMPKCVTHDQARWGAFHQLAAERSDLSTDDVFMSVVPAPFGFGIWTSHVTPTLLGVPTVVMPRFDAAVALRLMERHRVTVLAAVSTQFIMMLNAPGAAKRDLSSLRVLFTGGEAVPYERAAEFEERTGAAVLQFYGSNETGAVCGTSLRDTREKRLTTAGRVIPEMNVRLFDEAGRDVTAAGHGQPGCKGPTLSHGYFGDGPSVAAANRALIREDGWMMLGDIVTLDGDGYLEVIGRTDDFIIRGGKNISGPAVEEQVASHPAVALAAAVSMPDPVFGERVCVYVELQAGTDDLTLEALAGFLIERRVSKETIPERLEIVDTLPRGSGGKVAKQVLRDDIRRLVAKEAGEV
jgi:acyl-CoA synthetase